MRPTAVILYARKSVERENSISCETQLRYCRSAVGPIGENEEIISISDNGFSGGNINRDGFQKMMKMVKSGTVSKVVVYRLDRISRSLSDFVNILGEFKAHGVEFVSSQEAFDTSSPYGEMIVKILMVFAEFERASAISRVTQAYAHRSEMGLYMGGRRPYGFELVPAVINNIATKKLSPVPSEAEQAEYIFRVYARENVSLRSLAESLDREGGKSPDGGGWSASKLSSMLKNPVYVRADADVYDYYRLREVRIVNDASMFTGEFGAQLYGRNKRGSDGSEKPEMKLVLLTHRGIVDSDIWLKCQLKLERNKRVRKSVRNPTSWLAGRVFCGKCGCVMTTVKSRPNKEGEVRRYFNCTGRSHKKICTGPAHTVYAEDLEKLADECIAQKLSGLNVSKSTAKRANPAELNELKLKLREVDCSRQRLLDAVLAESFSKELIELANQKALQLKKDRDELCGRIEKLKSVGANPKAAVDLAKLWGAADNERRKEAAMILIDKIIVCGDGNIRIIWNI